MHFLLNQLAFYNLPLRLRTYAAPHSKTCIIWEILYVYIQLGSSVFRRSPAVQSLREYRYRTTVLRYSWILIEALGWKEARARGNSIYFFLKNQTNHANNVLLFFFFLLTNSYFLYKLLVKDWLDLTLMLIFGYC